MTPAEARDILGVGENATLGEIRRAYRSRAKVAHPDHGGTDEAARRLREAYECLGGGNRNGAANSASNGSAHPHSRSNANDRARTITVTTQQHVVANQAEIALARLGGVYVRARTLVHVVRDKSESCGLVYPDGYPVIARIGKERLREFCGIAADWQLVRVVRGEQRVESCMVPPWVAATLLERGEWRLPQLDGISDVPILRRDGSICETPGYDSATRVIYAPGETRYPPVPHAPTQADAAKALEDLLEPWREFAFVDRCDRYALAALVLTMLARSSIDGTTPMFVGRAPTPGSGKGLCIDGAAMLVTGRASPKRPLPTNDEELRKALFAHAIESPALLAFDNVVGRIGSPVLAMALTAGVVADRIMGSNTETRTVPFRLVMAATGANIQFRGDLARRVIPIDLDPKVEHPEDRVFEHPDFLAHIRDERPRLAVAALTVLRAYILAGKPVHGKPEMGSFESWDRFVRAPIIWAGGADPYEGVRRLRADGDEDLEQLLALLTAWRAQFGRNDLTIAQAIQQAQFGELRQAMSAYCGDDLSATKLGYVFRNLRGRMAGGLRLEKLGDAAAGVRWCVVGVGEAVSSADTPAREARARGTDETKPTQQGQQALEIGRKAVN